MHHDKRRVNKKELYKGYDEGDRKNMVAGQCAVLETLKN